MQAVINNLITTYTRSGKGKAVVLIHGWGDSSATFRALEAHFAKSYEMINVDLPGFGQTQAPSTVWGLDEYAGFLNSFLKKIGIEETHAFIGHSNGGAVLIRGLGKKIIKGDKLVLIASAGVRDRQKGKRAALKVLAKTGKAATFFLPEKHKRVLRKKLYGVAGSDMLVVPELQETFKKTVRQDVQQQAKEITVPTLLIYGSDDKATPVSDGERLHALIKNSSLKIINGASHYIHQEELQKVQRAIEEFLA